MEVTKQMNNENQTEKTLNEENIKQEYENLDNIYSMENISSEDEKNSMEENMSFADIKSIVWEIQCELRNKEGITGINAMHHILMVLLSKSFTDKKCQDLGIPSEFSYEKICNLIEKDLFTKFYNREKLESCILYWIRYGGRFGYTKDIPFQIKHESTLHFMYSKIKEIDIETLFSQTDLVGDIYEHFIDREGKTMKDLGQYFTDRTLINYLVKAVKPKLINDKFTETVYDPASGTGGFLTQFIDYYNKNHNINWEENSHNIYGSDLNNDTYVLLKLNMYFSTGKILEHLVLKDSLTINPSLETGFDIILMNPPFGVKGLTHNKDKSVMNEKIKKLKIFGSKGEILFLQHAMVNLKEGGRCCIVIPEGVLFNSTKMYKETRKYLLENFTLHKVLKMGEGEFFKNTGVKTSVLFFEKTGNPTQIVEFVQLDKVNNNIQEKLLLKVEMDKIKENDYSLNMNLYKEVELNVCKDFQVVKLGDICEIKVGKNISKNNRNGNKYPYYGSNGISGWVDEYLYDGEYVLHGDQGSVVGSVKYVNCKFYPSNHTLVLKPNSSLSAKYLYYYIKNRVNIQELLTGTVIPEIRMENFKMINIVIPSLDVQERLVEQFDNIYENEIVNSKNLIQGLEKSIETIMKNTLYLDGLQEYKIGDVCNVDRGNLVECSINKDENIYPYYAGKGISSFVPSYKFEGESIMMNYRLSEGAINPCIYIKEGKYNCSRFSWVITNKSTNSLKYMYNYFNANINYDNLLVGSTILEINSTNLKKYKIHIPSLDKQQEILGEIEPKERLIELLKTNIERAENQANQIMEQLFNKL